MTIQHAREMARGRASPVTRCNSAFLLVIYLCILVMRLNPKLLQVENLFWVSPGGKGQSGQPCSFRWRDRSLSRRSRRSRHSRHSLRRRRPARRSSSSHAQRWKSPARRPKPSRSRSASKTSGPRRQPKEEQTMDEKIEKDSAIRFSAFLICPVCSQGLGVAASSFCRTLQGQRFQRIARWTSGSLC